MKHTLALLAALLLAPLATTQGAPPDGAIFLGAEQALKEKGGFLDLLLAVIESEAFRTR